MEVRELTAEDYEQVVRLWRNSEGVALSSADSYQNISRYLERNPHMSFAAWEGDRLAGAVLCGHDGRRGYLHHLAVAEPFRRSGVGSRLVKECVAALRVNNIDRCHLFVHHDNDVAKAFWLRIGWFERDDLVMMSRDT